MADNQQAITAQNLDDSTVEVTIPDMGKLRIQRYFDTDTNTWGVSIANDLAPGVPVELSE